MAKVLDPEQGDIMGLLGQIVTLRGKAMERKLGKVGLTPERLAALRMCGSGGTSSATMAKVMCRESQSITGTIDRMERDELVEREPRRAGQPSGNITLTPKGREVMESADHINLSSQWADAALANIESDDKLEGLLRALRDAVAEEAYVEVVA